MEATSEGSRSKVIYYRPLGHRADELAAQEAGAVGCLIFTDPGDDGEITEAHGYAQYPDGPARQVCLIQSTYRYILKSQQSSVQRGSVQFVRLLRIKVVGDADLQISVYPGDPSTPGEPAYKNATRAEGTNQPSIPSLPISYEDAIPILNALEGHGTPAGEISEDWVGGLEIYGVEYFTGPSKVELHFVNAVNTRVMPIWSASFLPRGYWG
jgi:N-acetylated-alpha-linked acidic dipeptidase